MATLDSQFQEIYDTMMGYGNFVIVSGNTIINGNASINSDLCVLGSTILNNNTTMNSNLNILGNLVVNNIGTILSSLYISNNSIINNNLTGAANIYVSGNTYIQNNLQVGNTILINSTTIGSTINISDVTILNQGLNINNIGALNNSLTLNANIINIGNTNSKIFFNGTSTYIASSQLLLSDKLISLNSISNSSGIDLGGDCGIEILGTSGIGYIKTSLDASRYIIQPPLISQLSYIAIQDINNNINISGSAYLNTVSIISSLNVSGITTFNNITALSSLIVNNNASFYGNVSTIGILNVSGNTLFIGNNTIFGNINVSGNVILQGSTSILSNLNVGNSQIIQGNTTYLGILNVLNNSILQNTTILSNITSQGLTMFNNLVTINSNLNISNNYICNNNISINSKLYVSGYTIINNSSSINSSLNVLGNTIINSNITIYSNLNLQNYILLPLPNYPDNTTAKNNGIPIYGFYRTGDIVKIRLNDDPPTITLKGNSTISINYGSAYTELGITVTSPLYTNLYGYIYSIGSGTNNIITNQILVSGTSTLITQPSSLTTGSYLVSYNATDPDGLIGYTTRNLTVTPPPPPPPTGLTSLPTTFTQYGNVFSFSQPPGDSFYQVYSVSMSYSGSIISIGTRTNLLKGAIYIYQIINNVWTQLGNTIVGSANSDQMQYAKLSYDGLSIIVSGYNYKMTTIYSGKVEVYNYNGSSWIKKGQTLYGNTSNINGDFGYQIYISYDTNIITIACWPSISIPVILQVYQYSGTQWIQLGNSINVLPNTNSWQGTYVSSTGLINAYGAYNGSYTYIIASKYNSQSSTWEQLGSMITQSRYNLNGNPTMPLLSESGNIMIVLSNSKTIYSFFYNNIDWIIISSYTVNFDIPPWWPWVSVSADCMLLTSTLPMSNSYLQFYGYKNSAWQFINYYDTAYQYMDGAYNSSNVVCISGNGKYVISSGSGWSLPLNSIRIRIYQIN
uniref:Uncharacterized protein n=1 Tax=viral metagenome TaxID=1070528 RepID=A0A6C0H7A5_9ZZZZ